MLSSRDSRIQTHCYSGIFSKGGVAVLANQLSVAAQILKREQIHVVNGVSSGLIAPIKMYFTGLDDFKTDFGVFGESCKV